MLFLDTSALLKRYLDEDGTKPVLAAMDADPDWAVSALASLEAAITICHLGLAEAESSELRQRIQADMGDFYVVPSDAGCLRDAAAIGCDQRVRTLDAIHLAAALRLPGPVSFLTFDRRQSAAAMALGLRLVG